MEAFMQWHKKFKTKNRDAKLHRLCGFHAALKWTQTQSRNAITNEMLNIELQGLKRLDEKTE